MADMNKIVIRPFNVVDHTYLPEMSVDHLPTDGDPIEINEELYFVCEEADIQQSDPPAIGVVPLIVRNPAKVLNIQNYIQCLSIAHRKVQFMNDQGICDFDNCTEMIIS